MKHRARSMADIDISFDEFTDKYPRCRYTIRCWTPVIKVAASDVRPVPSTQRTSGGGILRPRHRVPGLGLAE